MIQKMSLYSMMMILLLALSAVWAPLETLAADPKVSDSYNGEQPATEEQEQPVEGGRAGRKKLCRRNRPINSLYLIDCLHDIRPD